MIKFIRKIFKRFSLENKIISDRSSSVKPSLIYSPNCSYEASLTSMETVLFLSFQNFDNFLFSINLVDMIPSITKRATDMHPGQETLDLRAVAARHWWVDDNVTSTLGTFTT